ncbi:adenylate/guanylate cyclase domain-containing protein [Corynebacterium bovis]|uniref:adenylate/guanylate cyclase domain-containing protein n=1 Tax=Corynebacterium bovis TaxID=36808 RepID=UPI0031395345
MKQFVRYLAWVWGTSWPLYAATVLFINVLGSVAVASFLRFLVPLAGAREITRLDTTTAALYGAYFFIAVVAGVTVTLHFFAPVLRWQRSPGTYDPNMVRALVLRIPALQTILGAVLWGVGVILFTAVAAHHSTRWGIAVGVAATLTGAMVCLLTYLVAERLVRPVAAKALTRGVPDHSKISPLSLQLMGSWILTSAVPVLGILLLVAAQVSGMFTTDAREILPGVVALSLTAILTGFSGTRLVTMNVVDPIRELQTAMNRVRRGGTDTTVRIYDSSEIGVLQAGFNEMMRGLRDREQVRELFGRYVGDEVARRALEEKPELGGENRAVAVLFVDVIGSTGFAVSREPAHVVHALNEFFDRVVDVVHRNRGMINKFEGDAALAVFGAPVPLDDIAGHALAAARELHRDLGGLELEAGIGVAAGNVVAGHIGAKDRFEFTVIGDAVNQAARLTDLAKKTPGHVLTSAATVRQANEAEQARWTMMKSVELRGRREMTQLARPVRPTLADRGADAVDPGDAADTVDTVDAVDTAGAVNTVDAAHAADGAAGRGPADTPGEDPGADLSPR